MKRGPLLLTVIAGAAVFLAVLVIYLPASWFAAALPAQVRCNEVAGSVWNGECLGLQVQDSRLGDVTWNLALGRLFTGRLAGDFALHGAAVSLRSDFDTSFSGVGELRNLSGQIDLDPALLPQFPAEQRGMVAAQFSRVELVAGPAARALQGTILLNNFRQVGARPMELGSYQVDFDGTVQPDNAVLGKLRDLGGPFAVTGTVTLTPPNAYLVQGLITGRSADAERIVRTITLGAMPDPSGRSTFSFEGSY